MLYITSFNFITVRKKNTVMAKSMLVQVVTFKLTRHYAKISRARVTIYIHHRFTSSWDLANYSAAFKKYKKYLTNS